MGSNAIVQRKVPGAGSPKAVFPVNSRSTGLLEKFVPEEKSEEKKPILRKVEVNSALLDLWRRFPMWHTPAECFKRAHKEAKKLNYSARDVEIFSLHMANFQDEPVFNLKAGYFLSVLVNAGKDREYTIYTDQLSPPPICIGYQNTKLIKIIGNGGSTLGSGMTHGKIVVEGDVENELGNRMRGGRIVVMCDAKDWAGRYMRGGRLTILGSAGNNIGEAAKGGRILVYGNAGWSVGNLMSTAKIHVFGELKGVETFMQGKIYHKDKCIAGKYFSPWQKLIDPYVYEHFKEPRI